MENKFLSLLKSRKFWAALVGFVFVVVGGRGDVDVEALAGAVTIVVAYIVGTALEDGLSRR